MGRARKHQVVEVSPRRNALSGAELSARAQWSCGLSGARGLSDRDMVLQLIEHCQLSRPNDETLADLALVVEELRYVDASDYAAISTALLRALALTA